jgi:hypothetical protein
MNRILEIMKSLFHDNDFKYTEMGRNQIAVGYESNYNYLNTVFEVNNDGDAYEHYTEMCQFPRENRGDIAEAAIAEPWREITPFMPKFRNKLYIYGSRSNLEYVDDDYIRDYILDDIGRVSSYDNDRRPFFDDIINGT